jgi:predicted ATPase/class 3 adenylate cyclase
MSVPELPAEPAASAPAPTPAPSAPVPSAPTSAPALAPAPPTATSPGRVESVTATFLMTDIEGSTRLWAEQREAMAVALTAHDTLLREAVERAGGRVFKTTGDGMLAVFERADGAIETALAAQRALDAEPWPTAAPLRVRMAIHAGTADVRDGDFFGPTLNRVARLLAIGHGGQVLVSSVAAGLVEDGLPAGAALVDRGEHRLRDLDRPEHVLQLVAPGLRTDFPPLRSAASRSNLPPELTSFVGREREIEEVRHLLGRSRVVSLVGVGGTGKTRLMLHLAGELVDRYADGVWLVELAPIADPGLVTQAVARALGVPDTGRPELEAVVDFLREKDLLLLLDNCEHLIDAAAALAERLLRDCRAMRIVATSREALGIDGEASVPVPSLGLPGGRAHGPEQLTEPVDPEAVAAADSVRLFIDRASTTLPGFALDAVTAGPVVEICRRLDGIPLALELAAARVNVLSVAEIAQGLGDRFRLLTGGRRTAVPRQQTLQALIDWSWDLLTEADQRLLRRLSVFAGGWTLEAAAEVTADRADGAVGSGIAGSGIAGGSAAPAIVASGSAAARLKTLDGLGRLVDRSLVVVEHEAETRYRMLETIRQYASDRLVASGESPALRARHLARFRRLALDAAPALVGPDVVVWVERLDAELDNLRAALDWASESDAECFVEMTVALGQYWRIRTIGTEGMDRLQQAIDVARRLQDPAPDERAGRDALLARLFAMAAMVGGSTNRRTHVARGWAAEAIALAVESGDRGALGSALGSRFLAAVFTGEEVPGEIAALGKDVVEVATEVEDWFMLAQASTSVGIHVAAWDPEAADRWLAQAVDVARRSGSPFAIGFAAMGWGEVLGYRGRLDEARPYFEEALARFQEIDDRRMQLVVRSTLSHALRQAGHLDEAMAEYRVTIREWQRLGQRGAIAHQLESFALVALERDDPIRAATLLGAADALRAASGSVMISLEQEEYDAAIERLRERLGTDVLERARAEGRALTTEQAVAFTLSG